MEDKIDPYVKVVGAPIKRKPVIKRSRPKKLGLPGSFWIPRECVEALLTSRATAVQIGVYLVIAKHTDRAGRISTAGARAIRNRLGIADKQIHAALDFLYKLDVPAFNMEPRNNRLLYTASDWNCIVNMDTEYVDPHYPCFAHLSLVGQQKSKRVRTSWVINNVGIKRYNGIWFNNALIGKYGDDERPLADIIRLYNADSIMRFLLMLHHHYDIDMGGVDPTWVKYEYKQIDTPLIIGNYALHKFKFDRRYADSKFRENIYNCILGCDDEYDNSKVITFLSEAFDTLDRMGLISRLVAAWSKPQAGGDSVPLYLLDQKSDFRHLPRDKETMMADHIEKAAISHGMGSSSGNNGFYDTYTVLTPLGINPNVVQVYKPTYVVEYRNNPRVRQALQQREYNAAQLKKWLLELGAQN